MNNYLEKGFVASDSCLVEGIRKLETGHFMSYSHSTHSVRVTQYWAINKTKGLSSFSPLDRDIQKTRDLLEESIVMQLRSDVPVGVLLVAV